ncbi:MAG: BcpO-related WXXGXW repeat protein [Bacteroidetes bacterium]|nr:BcpO-related WXXGXW repeat protein [Bacteroidota bacterium]
MKKFPFLFAALMLAGLLLPTMSEAQVMVRTKHVAPGVTVVKTKPVKPGRNYVWVDGYWDYIPRLNRHVYVEGYWAKAPNRKRVKVVKRHQCRRH